MLDPKLQEALGNLILTYGEDNARELWIETYGFRIDLLMAMAKYHKSGVVSTDKLLESMKLLRDFHGPYDLEPNSEYDSTIEDDSPSSLTGEIGVIVRSQVLRRHRDEQCWGDFIDECDLELIAEMVKRHSRDMEGSNGN